MSHTFRVVQGRTVEVAHASTDPLTFQLECVEAFVTSRVVRGFSAVTIENETCLLYTSDAADDTPCVDLGGRRIIKKIF